MTLSPALRQLADLHGVEVSYTDNSGVTHVAAPAALLAVLRALGVPLSDVHDAEAALATYQKQTDLIEPVLVAWEGLLQPFVLRVPPGTNQLHYELWLEDGSVRSGSLPVEPGAQGGLGRLTDVLPLGYHELIVDYAGRKSAACIIAAPGRAHSGRNGQPERAWGLFLPLYAVRSAHNQGIADYTRLGDMLRWTDQLGGAYFGTLPLLATFLDQPFEPSPYAPVSRLFWSDAFIDVRAAHQLLTGAAAAECSAVSEILDQSARLNDTDLVDYREAARVKRRALEPLARCFFAQGGAQSQAFRTFEQQYPRVRDYAAFRAACDQRQQGWPVWPERMREGRLQPDDYDAASAEYHLFAQFAAVQQLAAVAAGGGARLYLDLPLGVHPDGYDVWRDRRLFVSSVSTGAPPDDFFTHGQDWGFPPLNPESLRADGYRYLRETLQTHLRYAAALRLDHVMALHRLFWVPSGFKATEGVYVRYPSDELYALLCLESHRHRALIIGEDLGTVPPEVRERMARHEISRMYVVQFEARADQPQPLETPPHLAAASLNTHDMPTFEAFRRALDADLRGELQLIEADEIALVRHQRRELIQALAQQLTQAGFLHGPAGPEQIRDALLAFLAAAPVRLLLVNLEDLWREERPQNVPGTGAERPNWRRRTRPSLEEIMNDPEVTAVLNRLNEIRRES